MIERIGGTVNAVIVKLPERQDRGVVIQRDSIANLQSLVRDAKERLKANDWDEVSGVLDELDELISGYMSAFEQP